MKAKQEERGVLGVPAETGQTGPWGKEGVGLSLKHPFQEPVSKVAVCLFSLSHTQQIKTRGAEVLSESLPSPQK